MGHSSYYSSLEARKQREQYERIENDRVAQLRKKLAAKIVMAVVDKVVAEIVRPGPVPEERECYEMAGELQALVPDLEMVAKKIIDAENGVE
jgi:hypothetical protein